MANGDLTKTTEYDKIEIVGQYNIQVRRADCVMEEHADGSLKELSRGFHRHVLQPFTSVKTEAVEAVEAVAAVDEVTDSDGNVTTEAVVAVEAVAAVAESWAHTPTDISGEAAQVQAIANAAWTDAAKDAYKAVAEAASI
jgi:predicted ABC-type transport system involved in lysophospholipase L1 biosynthesis ATPase subunit